MLGANNAIGRVKPQAGGAVQRSVDVVFGLSIRRVRRVLLLIVLGLAVASALAQVAKYQLDFASAGIANLFDANFEANLPTLYSTVVLALAAFLLAAIAVSERGEEASSRWIALSGLFALAAVDEAASIHELLNDPLRSWLGTGGFLSYPWIIVGAVLALAVAIFFRRFVGRLPPAVRRLAVLGVLLFATGALVVEGFENLVVDRSGGEPTLWSGLVGTLSELCEMVGVVLIIEALLLFIARERGSVSIVIRPQA